jgi:UDP-N-acetyl-D-glucosamine dehydrogenase
MESVSLSANLLAAQNCVLIATDHTSLDYAWIVEHAQLVVDTRNATRDVTSGREKILKS